MTPPQQRLIDDRLWDLIQPLLPARPRPRGPGGRPRIDDRAALEAILFVLRTGCRWRDLPPQLRCSHRHQPGRPRRRPEKLHADKGYDYPRCRRYLHRRGIKVRIARRGIEDKSKLGRHRWVVERTVSWLLRFKRLGLRYDRTEATLRSLLLLAVSMINLKRLILSS